MRACMIDARRSRSWRRIVADDLRAARARRRPAARSSASGARQAEVGHDQRRELLQRVVEAADLDADEAAAADRVVVVVRLVVLEAGDDRRAGRRLEGDRRDRLGVRRRGGLRQRRRRCRRSARCSANARPPGAAAPAGSDSGTTLTISPSAADALAHGGDAEPAAARSGEGTNCSSRRAGGRAAIPCTSCSRSAVPSFDHSSAGNDVVAARGRARAGAVCRSALSASSSSGGAGGDRLALRPAPATRCSIARTPLSRSSTAPAGSWPAARSAARSTASMAWARSTIGSTPTIAARPLMVCSDRNSSRTWRGVDCPGGAPARRPAGWRRRAQVLVGLGDEPATNSAASKPALTRLAPGAPRSAARTSARSASGANGLVMKRVAPAASARARELSSPRVVTTRIGRARSLSWPRTNSTTSKPPMSGMLRSRTTRSNALERQPLDRLEAARRLREDETLDGPQASDDHLAHHFAVVDDQCFSHLRHL